MSNDLFLPGTEVVARGLKWEVVEAQPMGEQTRVRLRGTGRFGGFEVDVLTPFEPIEPLIHDLDPNSPANYPTGSSIIRRSCSNRR